MGDTTIAFGPTDLPGPPDADLVHALVVMTGEETGRRVELGDRAVIIGRAEEADIRIQDPGLSARHCRVISGGELVLVEDLGSTNGTFVDRVRVHGLEPLPVASLLQVGATLLTHECRPRGDLIRVERLESELERACQYVLSILPKPLDEGPVRTLWRFIPSEVLGGDAFGYHWLDSENFAVYLLDVCGHGAEAALHSVSVLNVLRRRALRSVDFADPADVLHALNRAFPMEEFGGLYFTIWYGVFRKGSRTLKYATAGHPPALLMKQGKRSALQLRTRGPGIGMLADAEFHSGVVPVDPGARLYLFSDGVYEVPTASEGYWTLDGLLGVLGEDPGEDTGELDRVEARIRTIMAGKNFGDDFSLLIADFLGEGTGA